MTTKRKTEPPLDKGLEELSLLGEAVYALQRMDDEVRARALRYLKSRFSKEWPSDS